MNLSRLFRSRWAAMFWSAGIVWTAYDVANDAPSPSPPAGNAAASEDATGSSYDAHDLQILANAVN